MNAKPEKLAFLKAAMNADRLRIVGLLTRGGATRAEVAAALNLSARDSLNHIAYLEYAGVVKRNGDVYVLDGEKLAALSRDGFADERPAGYEPAPELDSAVKKILKAHLYADGSLRQIPSQPAKLRVILAYLIQSFETEKDYSEREVNQVLRRFHADIAGLRRDLVDANLLARESDGSRYWRVGT